MAVDSARKRFSMMNFGSPIIMPLFIPDGTIDDEDRYHLLNLYYGINIGPITSVLAGRWSERQRGTIVGTLSLVHGPYHKRNF